MTVTIGDGVAGQIKTITVLQAAGTITVSGANIRATTITATSTGATIQLQWLSSKWAVISNVGFNITL